MRPHLLRPAIAAALLWALAALGCAHGVGSRRASSGAPAPRFVPDATRLDPWDADRAAALGLRAPYVARYRRDGRALSFVAVTHRSMEGTPSFRLVRREFLALRPDFVLIEGIPAALGADPPDIVRVIRQVRAPGPWPVGESFFAASLALSAGVPFAGAEPSRREEAEGLRTAGFSLDDMLSYFLLRQIPEWRREHAPEPLPRMLSSYAAEWYREQRLPNRWTPSRLSAWCRSHLGHPFDASAVRGWETEPATGPHALFTQRIAAADLRVRDGFVVGQIARALNEHRRVLVVYGAGHHFTERRVLQQMLGAPELAGPH